MKITFHVRSSKPVRSEGVTFQIVEQTNAYFNALDPAIEYLRSQIENPLVGGIQMTLEDLR